MLQCEGASHVQPSVCVYIRLHFYCMCEVIPRIKVSLILYWSWGYLRSSIKKLLEKTGQFRDCSAETLTSLIWNTINVLTSYLEAKKQFKYTFYHIWFSFLSLQVEREREGNREADRESWGGGPQRLSKSFSEPLTTLPHLPRQHTDLQEPTQRHTDPSKVRVMCVMPNRAL